MQMVRDWRRRLFGTAIGALVAPVAIVGAGLAVGLGGGGLEALGALGQALDGPRLPAAAPLTRPGDARDTGRLLAQARRDAAAAATEVTPTGAGTAADGDTTDGARTPPPGAGFDPAGATPPATPGTPPPPVPTTAPPPAAEAPGPVRQVGDSVREVTDRLPVVSEPTGQIVDDVVETVDSVVSP